MKTSSFINIGKRTSALKGLRSLRPGMKKSGSGQSSLALALPLTSLIDAFSIIVIYLLIGTQNNGIESEIPTKLNLPVAEHSTGLDKKIPTLTIQKGVYLIDNEVVQTKDLSDKLKALKQKSQNSDNELLVQADQNMKYQELDPLLKASSLSGFEKMKFAVVPSR